MSHPLRDAIPAGRCEYCQHFAPATGELSECSRCGCDRHVAAPGSRNSLYGGHDPATPPGSEAALQAFLDALGPAREALEQAMNEEVDAELARDAARRRAQFSPDCPKVGVFAGVRTTVAERDAWVEEQIAGAERTFRLAKAKREATKALLDVLGKQLSAQQSLSRSVGQSYMGQREPGW